MRNTAILSVRIIGDAVSATTALTTVDRKIDGTQRNFAALSAAGAAAVGVLVAAAMQAADVASQAEQASGAVASVFGAQASAIEESAARAANAVGLGRDQYLAMAAVFGAQLGNMGVAADQLAGRTDYLIGLGADLAAQYGGTTADAVNALSSLLRGERDPIERYGVSIKEADVQARLAAMGLTGLTGEAEKAATMQATLGLLAEQTAAAQGRFAAETDTAAGAQQIATANWRDAQAVLGEQLLPYLTAGATALADVARWVQENSDTATILIGVLGGLAFAVATLTAAQWLFNIAAMANPVGLVVAAIVLGIGALIAIIALLVQNWEWVSSVASGVFDQMVKNIQPVIDAVSSLVGWIIDAVNWFGNLGGASSSASGATQASVDTTRFASAPMLRTFAAPMTLSTATATTARGVPSAASIAPRSQQQAPASVFNVTVNGAIDPDGTARTVRNTLRDFDRRVGTTVAAGGR
jgi:hypothetical protein